MAAATDRIADALHASEARLRTILETAVDAFITINEAGIVESFNPGGRTAVRLRGRRGRRPERQRAHAPALCAKSTTATFAAI